METYRSIDEYLSNYSGETRKKLDEIRRTIHEAVPDAKEKISYGIPTFELHGNLVHFAGYKTHIGFYPGASAVAEFENQLTDYRISKGTIQLPLNKPLPLDLIRQITEMCVVRNLKKSKQ